MIILPATFVADFHDEALVRRMPYRRLGGTGLDISALSLGGGTYGGVYGETVNPATVNQLVETAIRSGVNYIDTSYWYGQGKSEERLGEVCTASFE